MVKRRHKEVISVCICIEQTIFLIINNMVQTCHLPGRIIIYIIRSQQHTKKRIFLTTEHISCIRIKFAMYHARICVHRSIIGVENDIFFTILLFHNRISNMSTIESVKLCLFESVRTSYAFGEQMRCIIFQKLYINVFFHRVLVGLQL